jgi:hypothetical protein
MCAECGGSCECSLWFVSEWAGRCRSVGGRTYGSTYGIFLTGDALAEVAVAAEKAEADAAMAEDPGLKAENAEVAEEGAGDNDASVPTK